MAIKTITGTMLKGYANTATIKKIYSGNTVVFEVASSAHAYVITSGSIRGGQMVSNALVSYSIKLGTTTLKSGSIRVISGTVALTSTEINSFNAAMGTGGGTFSVIVSTMADMSSVQLTLTFSTDGAGATTKSATGSYDTLDGYAITGYLAIP